MKKNGMGQVKNMILRLKFEGEYINGERKGKEYNIMGTLIFEGQYKDEIKYNGKGYDNNGNELYELINGNGKIKEYDFLGNLIFEGEYLNGKKWNGKEYHINQPNFSQYSNFEVKISFTPGNLYLEKDGKYYFKDQLIYEGQYLNGQRNGFGKEYDQRNGKLIFEGDYLNGKKWNGNIKEYQYYGKLQFEGQYLNGEKNGNGKEYDEFGRLKFEGKYLNGKKWNGYMYIYDNYGKLIIKKPYSYSVQKIPLEYVIYLISTNNLSL